MSDADSIEEREHARASLLAKISRIDERTLERAIVLADIYEETVERRIRRLGYFGTALSAVFLLQQVVPGQSFDILRRCLGIAGAALAVVVIALSVWVWFSRWPSRLQRRRELGRMAQGQFDRHKALDPAERTLEDMEALRADCMLFEKLWLEEWPALLPYYQARAFRRTCERHSHQSIMCGHCG